MNLPGSVKLVEVGPRDGLQSEKKRLNTETRVNFVNNLSATGLQHIEVGSFVSEKWVPQMANSDEVFKKIRRHKNVGYSALTPNIKGLERAIECGVSEIAIFISASESFSQKNINCSIEQSIQRLSEVARQAIRSNMSVRGYVSCVAGCPYEGTVDIAQVSKVTDVLFELGCYEVSLGDTIGVATPLQIQNILSDLSQSIPVHKLAVHMHDTYGQALANIFAALQTGVQVIDSSVAGIGGCPYARGASGNVATEDVVYMLNGLGIKHGVNLPSLISAGEHISLVLGRKNASKVAIALSTCR